MPNWNKLRTDISSSTNEAPWFTKEVKKEGRDVLLTYSKHNMTTKRGKQINLVLLVAIIRNHELHAFAQHSKLLE